MLDDDPLAPPPRKADPALDRMSIEELTARVASLQAEIAACEAAIRSKQAQRAAADAMFARGAQSEPH
jgi:uncharacterized small protein (DUF1192 family)